MSKKKALGSEVQNSKFFLLIGEEYEWPHLDPRGGGGTGLEVRRHRRGRRGGTQLGSGTRRGSEARRRLAWMRRPARRGGGGRWRRGGARLRSGARRGVKGAGLFASGRRGLSVAEQNGHHIVLCHGMPAKQNSPKTKKKKTLGKSISNRLANDFLIYNFFSKINYC